MEHESFFNLFDSLWFQLNIFNNNSTSSITSTTTSEDNLKDSQKNETPSEQPKLTRIRTVHNRSMSDQSITNFNHDSLSPDSVLISSKLETILSGKEVTDTEDENLVQTQTLLHKNNNSNINKVVKKRRGSKSLSDLEFEELKGFMDLGFVFSEEDKDSSLVEIIPGLQRLGKKNEETEEEEKDESVVQRPYLSEAWEVYEWKKKEKPLMNWKVPSLNNEIDMKNSLRLWAHTVASTVR
ncbi:hypothetical protein TSUD_69310 [Trifolium subterraneum]|uniref:DUF1685 domain-containing protein n=1 Tax=Trifolium subterraneum TaxID=3900 RepID=A0A2Z6NCT3_TRISU|nr:hypothetical protein TSUD_69310 [Trifolium subterraneum]